MVKPYCNTGRIKEPNFFNDNFSKGVSWYHSLYESDNKDVRVDFSNTYSFSPEVPHRIAKYNDKAKVFILCRDPIERFKSHVDYDKLFQPIKTDVSLHISNNSHYLERSKIEITFQRFIDAGLKPELIMFDDLINRPENTIRKHFNWVNTSSISKVRGINPARTSRFLVVSSIGKFIAVLLRKFGFFIRFLTFARILHWLILCFIRRQNQLNGFPEKNFKICTSIFQRHMNSSQKKFRLIQFSSLVFKGAVLLFIYELLRDNLTYIWFKKYPLYQRKLLFQQTFRPFKGLCQIF